MYLKHVEAPNALKDIIPADTFYRTVNGCLSNS